MATNAKLTLADGLLAASSAPTQRIPLKKHKTKQPVTSKTPQAPQGKNRGNPQKPGKQQPSEKSPRDKSSRDKDSAQQKLDLIRRAALEKAAPLPNGEQVGQTAVVKEKKPIPPQPTGIYDPQNPWKSGVDWFIVGWIALAHVGALAAPFVFTWHALIYTAITIWFTASIGICLGYHRLLTHNSFKTYRPIRWFLALLGSLTGEGSAMNWVANHRMHHQHSDKDGDPHSPRHGGLWSHMLWFMPHQGAVWQKAMYEHYIPDMYRDPVMRFLDKTFLLWHFVVGFGTLFGAYAIYQDWYTAWSFVVWGVFVRMVYTMHITWFVNSATHTWGYRNYETTDDSTNLWWVGLAAFGEGWHNNHHAYQTMAKHGHKWWEVDVTYWAILAMEKCGLAWNVVKDRPNHKPA
ncbi:MAG: fatty acid desaturase [Pirellulales bacterium]|nr:fatty acid desaturase [Pirellulales bacterium]